MSVKYGKTELNQMLDALEEDYDSPEAAALAILERAEQIFQKRAKFCVIGQLTYDREHGHLEPSDPRAVKMALAWYSTEGDAVKAAESLWKSTSTGDEWRAWVVSVHHGSPSDLHAQRKKQVEQEEAKRREKASEAARKSIEQRAKEADERARAYRALCTCGHQAIEHRGASAKWESCTKRNCPCFSYEPSKD